MKCCRRHIFLSVLAFFFLFIFGLFVNSSNSYAVSDLTVTYSGSDVLTSGLNVFSSCIDSNCLSDYSYLIYSNSCSNVSNINSFNISFNSSNTPRIREIRSWFDYLVVSIPDHSLLQFSGIGGTLTVSQMFDSSCSSSGSLTFTLTNTLPSSPSGSLSITENGTYDVTNYSQAVVDVTGNEVIVQGDYHDDLVKIYNAIIVCAGVIMVLYFFYCIYRIFIKTIGGF